LDGIADPEMAEAIVVRTATQFAQTEGLPKINIVRSLPPLLLQKSSV
jgi:hypothetical protein